MTAISSFNFVFRTLVPANFSEQLGSMAVGYPKPLAAEDGTGSYAGGFGST